MDLSHDFILIYGLRTMYGSVIPLSLVFICVLSCLDFSCVQNLHLY